MNTILQKIETTQWIKACNQWESYALKKLVVYETLQNIIMK